MPGSSSSLTSEDASESASEDSGFESGAVSAWEMCASVRA